MGNLTVKSLRVGEVIVFLGKLQLFWLLASLRHGIILGVFPTMVTVMEYLQQAFVRRAGFEVKKFVFDQKVKAYFRMSNQAGFLSLLVIGILWVNLRIAWVFIQSTPLTVTLGFFSALVVSTILYVFPVLTRYDLQLKDVFIQAFYLMISNFSNTLAMYLGTFFSLMLAIFIPVLVLLPVPFVLLPIVWFSWQSMRKLEIANGISVEIQ